MTVLPDGFVIRLADSVRVRDNGRTLIGGAPLRVSHLNDSAPTLHAGETLTIESPATRAFAEALLASGMADPVVGVLDDIDLNQVTCVIPVRDRAPSLDRLLTALHGLPKIIVVDDCSLESNTVTDVATRHGADLVSLDRNVGPAGARNAGLAEVTTPYVMFVDSDIVITIDQVRKLVRHFADPGLAVVAPRIRSLDDSQGWLADYERARSSLDLGPESALVHPRSKVSWVPSAVLLARVQSLEDGFDASMYVGEDVDLIWRLTDAGWRVRYEAGVDAHHEHRTSFAPWFTRKAFYGSGAEPLAARHGYKVAPAVFTPASAAIAVAALAQRRWSIPVIALAAGAMNHRLTRAVVKSPRPRHLAAELTGLGVSASLSQLMGLLLRHWWPLAAIGSLRSARFRRAVAVAAITDTVIEYERLNPDMDILRFGLARRLDDLAYGAGLWAGASRRLSARALRPDINW